MEAQIRTRISLLLAIVTAAAFVWIVVGEQSTTTADRAISWAVRPAVPIPRIFVRCVFASSRDLGQTGTAT